MSCICRKPRSPYWQAKFRDGTGRVVMRSTKQTDSRKARKVAETWEDAGRKARAGELTQAAAIKVLGDLMEQTIGERLVVDSIAKFLTGWAEARQSTTAKRYSPIIKGFLASIGERRAAASIASVTASEIERFRDAEIAAGKGATTANFSVKVLRAALGAARRKGLALTNPAEAVDAIETAAEAREVFASNELRALLKAAGTTSWRGMILLGLYCGIRINDAANLTWEAVSLDDGTVTLMPAKTEKKKKVVTIALHPDLRAYLERSARGIGRAPLFPDLHGRPSGSAGGLSNAFAALMKKAGIIVRLGEVKTGKGRRFRSKSFHCFRHTLVSRLTNANVLPDVRMAIVGHSDDAAHRRYTHLELQTQRKAIEALESVG